MVQQQHAERYKKKFVPEKQNAYFPPKSALKKWNLSLFGRLGKFREKAVSNNITAASHLLLTPYEISCFAQ